MEKVLPTEVINEYKEYRMDYVVITNKNIIVDFEFHSSSLREKDIKRYANYAYILGNKYDLDVITIVVSTYYTENFTETFKIHKKASHPIYIHSLKSIDGDEIFRKINKKHKLGEKISKKDISKLALIPFYGSKYPIEEVLYNIVDLTNNLKIDYENFAFLKKSQMEFIKYFVKDEYWYNKLIKVFNMNLDPLDEYMEEVYNRKINNAKQEAVNKSTLEIAKNMIKNKCTKDQVINSTKITEKQFLTLLKV